MANFSCTLTATPSLIVPQGSERRTYLSINIVGGTGVAWLTHLTSTPGPGIPGSYLLPMTGISWNAGETGDGFCPQGAVWGVAAPGPTEPPTDPKTAILTVEAV